MQYNTILSLHLETSAESVVYQFWGVRCVVWGWNNVLNGSLKVLGSELHVGCIESHLKEAEECRTLPAPDWSFWRSGNTCDSLLCPQQLVLDVNRGEYQESSVE